MYLEIHIVKIQDTAKSSMIDLNFCQCIAMCFACQQFNFLSIEHSVLLVFVGPGCQIYMELRTVFLMDTGQIFAIKCKAFL